MPSNQQERITLVNENYNDNEMITKQTLQRGEKPAIRWFVM